jgi:hypothetical protein
VEPALAWDPSALVGVGSVSVNKLEVMYAKMHAYLSESGIDGVKVGGPCESAVVRVLL